MKRIFLGLLIALLGTGMGFSQKFAFVDTDYILGRIPSYDASQKQLDKFAADWQAEIEGKRVEIEKLYKDYQAERVLLTDEMRASRENDIIQREQALNDLKKKYFAPEGELFQKRQELVKPIQDDVFNAVKELAQEGSYDVIFDTASGPTMLYTNPRYDKSEDILEKLGIQN
jgi:outer membrane protein